MRAVGVVLVVTALVAGCGGDGTSSQTDDSVAATTPPQPAATVASSTSAPTAEPTTTVPVGATDESSTTAPSTTVTPDPTVARTVLRPDGVGEVDFGTSAEDTIAELSALLGPPDRVEPITPVEEGCVEGAGWLDCVRDFKIDREGQLAVWSDAGLAVALVDTGLDGEPGLRFGDWHATKGSTDPPLMTVEGLHVGMTVAELKQAVPDVEFTYNEGLLDSYYLRNDDEGGYWGRLDWTPTTARIDWVGVAQIQTALNEHGADLVVDGIWGPRTQAAWTAFQADHGIEPVHQTMYMTPEIGAALGLPPDDITVATIEPRPPLDPATPTATEALPILRADGLGPVAFGATAEQATLALTDLLGPPDRDTVSTEPDCILAIEQARTLSWESLGLHAVLTDWPGELDLPPTPLHLATWTVWARSTPPVALSTPDGIGIGSTASDVRSLPSSSPIIPDVSRWGFEIVNATGSVQGDLDWSVNLPYYFIDEQFAIELQHALNSSGADLKVDGIVGPATTSALVDFAARHRIAGFSIEPNFDSIQLTTAVLEVFWLLGLPPDDAPVAGMWAGDPSTCG